MDRKMRRTVGVHLYLDHALTYGTVTCNHRLTFSKVLAGLTEERMMDWHHVNCLLRWENGTSLDGSG